jgi:TM2 domain-containing membrane protein YozV
MNGMNARTFGRKGAGEAGVSARRTAFLGLNRAQDFAPSAPPPPADEAAGRREAFLAAERARAEDIAPTGAMPGASEEAIKAVLAGDAPPLPPTDRSIRLTYALWFLTGLFGGHRLYLRRPITGGVQALIFFGCCGAAVLQYYWAFAVLSVSWLWMLADGIRIKRLHETSGRG